MIGSIAAFEIRYQFKLPLFYLVFLFLAMMTFFAVTSDSVQIGGAVGNVNRNAPIVILRFMAVMCAMAVFVVTAFVASAAHRDFARNTHELIFSRPVGRWQYLLGRFSGAVVISLLVMLGPAVGILLGSLMPWLEPERLGPFQIGPYLYSFLILILPTVLFVGAVFFILAGLTRSMMATYMGVVIFFAGYVFAAYMLGDMENEALGALFDPFGMAPIQVATKYWTVVEMNTSLPPVAGPLLWNRLLWSGIGLAVFLIGGNAFKFTYGEGGWRWRRRRTSQETPAVNGVNGESPIRSGPSALPVFAADTAIRQFLHQTRMESASIFRSIPFLVILAFGLLNVFAGVQFSETLYGTSLDPVTNRMLRAMDNAFLFLVMIIVTFYSGELIWRERSKKLDEVHDALPTPSWVFLAGKLSALALVVFTFILTGAVVLILYQLLQGYTRIEPLLYLKGMLIGAAPFLLVCVLALTVQVLANSKFIGYAIMIIYLIGDDVYSALDFDHHLYRFASAPRIPYSDMNGYGHFVAPFLWYNAYWFFFCVVLVGICLLFWVRGTDGAWRNRFRLARERFRGTARAAVYMGLAGFILTGSIIFYNTNVLNEYIPGDKEEALRASYEKQFRQYIDVPLPRINDVRADVDIFPRERRVEIRGQYAVVNETDSPIHTLHVNIPREVDVNGLDFPAHTASGGDEKLGYSIYTLEEPLPPGGSMTFAFDLTVSNPGFVNHNSNTQVVYDGSFFSNYEYFPRFGYQTDYELRDRSTRRNHDLPPANRMPAITDASARRNTCFSLDSDWVTFETTVSTSADQLAIAPGYLQREWTEGNRRYFRYTMDAPMLNFFSYLSADYTVARDRWNDVAIEIYYHEPHGRNVDRMIDSIKKSLDYYTANFGPYQHRQVRIVEFPRYASFAQSFPNTIPYSESIGFIARIDDTEDIDYVFYVTAHEVAHQWWAHQCIGANVQGATMLSEAMCQYSALMVMEKEYGRDKMRRFLKYELDRYLDGRGGEMIEETPLQLVENQPYIHYNKGSVVMYALRDYLGEEVLNGAISRYLGRVAFQEPPFTISTELIDEIRLVTPDHLRHMIDDMFASITLFSNQVLNAEASESDDGSWTVNLELESRKYRADGRGVETEIPVDDWVEIAVFGETENGGETEETVLYLQKHHITETNPSLSLSVTGRPVRAGIDPYNKLVDRISDDNVKRVS